jgi:hypothetical protein
MMRCSLRLIVSFLNRPDKATPLSKIHSAEASRDLPFFDGKYVYERVMS